MKIKNIWKEHKTKILIGGGILMGGTLILVVAATKLKVKIPMLTPTQETFSWTFENLDEAITKFKGIEDACINLGKGEAALFATSIVDGTYTVMYL